MSRCKIIFFNPVCFVLEYETEKYPFIYQNLLICQYGQCNELAACINMMSKLFT